MNRHCEFTCIKIQTNLVQADHLTNAHRERKKEISLTNLGLATSIVEDLKSLSKSYIQKWWKSQNSLLHLRKKKSEIDELL